MAIQAAPAAARPNILFLLGDNWQFEHAGANGYKAVQTPVFDRIASEGARFTHAFCPVPSCGPTRSSMVTGRAAHELEDLANHGGIFHGKFRAFVDGLAVGGYHVGHSGKGWAPGIYEGYGRTETPAGKAYRDLPTFFEARKPNQPFFFWLGSTHTALRFFKPGTGKPGRINPAAVRVPAYLPDLPEVRLEIACYLNQVETMDAAFGEAVRLLEQRGELDNTIIVCGSDNGWQFPRGLGNVYDSGCHVPLAIRWPGRVRPGRVIEDFVSVTDYAPTFLEMAGLVPWPEMTARSFLEILVEDRRDPRRDHVFVERERHANVRRGDLSYPIRGVRTKDFLYIRNLRPKRHPAGDPIVYHSVGDYGDIDEAAVKALMMERQNEPSMQKFFALSFKKRPAEELYDLRRDPDQIDNIAARPEYAAVKKELGGRIDGWMKVTKDPRLDPRYDGFDKFPYYGGGLAPQLRRWDEEN